jgi:hypothetical protein
MPIATEPIHRIGVGYASGGTPMRVTTVTTACNIGRRRGHSQRGLTILNIWLAELATLH